MLVCVNVTSKLLLRRSQISIHVRVDKFTGCCYQAAGTKNTFMMISKASYMHQPHMLMPITENVPLKTLPCKQLASPTSRAAYYQKRSTGPTGTLSPPHITQQFLSLRYMFQSESILTLGQARCSPPMCAQTTTQIVPLQKKVMCEAMTNEDKHCRPISI